MPRLITKLYFQSDALIRKEHFGTLILMRDGRRYLVENKYFNLSKCLYKKLNIDECKGVSRDDKERIKSFLIDRKIIGFEKGDAKPKFIENKFISRDCLSFPRTIYWESTRKCNYECIHCYSSSGPNQIENGIPFEVIKKLINELSERGAEFLSIGGGEPLLYPHLEEVIKYSTKKGVAVEISTNASLINNIKIKKFKEAGLKFIQVSLNGATQKTYLKIHKGGDFKRVIENISKLTKNFIVTICVVVNKLNYGEIDDLIEISKKLGAVHFRVIPLMNVGRAAKMISFLQLSKNTLRKLYKHLLKKKEKEKNNINIQLNRNLIFPEIKNISWIPENHYGCSAGRSTCGIDAYGNVYPCSYMLFDELKCGNIKEKTLLEIWRDSPVMKKIRNLEKLEDKCANCKFLNLCRGGCRALAYTKTGKINGSDPLCIAC